MIDVGGNPTQGRCILSDKETTDEAPKGFDKRTTAIRSLFVAIGILIGTFVGPSTPAECPDIIVESPTTVEDDAEPKEGGDSTAEAPKADEAATETDTPADKAEEVAPAE